MAYIDPGMGFFIFSIFMAIFALGAMGWVCNIIGLATTPNLFQTNQGRFILHIVGIFISPLGAVMGLLWFFSWRKQTQVPPPPPPSGPWAPPTPSA